MHMVERVYTIPLRKEIQKAPPTKRAKKAVRAVREFITHHMHTENVGIGPELNDLLWERGIRNPPHKVTVQVKTTDTGAYANLVGKSLDPVKVEQKVTAEQKNMLEEQLTKLTGKKDEKDTSENSSEKSEEEQK